MNGLQHQPLILDALDALDFVVCGDLRGLAELTGQNNPNARLSEPNGKLGGSKNNSAVCSFCNGCGPCFAIPRSRLVINDQTWPYLAIGGCHIEIVGLEIGPLAKRLGYGDRRRRIYQVPKCHRLQ